MNGGQNNGNRHNSSSDGIGGEGNGHRARAGGREVTGLNLERMREMVEMINQARAAETERSRRREASSGQAAGGNNGNVGDGESGMVYAPANTPANGDESPSDPPLESDMGGEDVHRDDAGTSAGSDNTGGRAEGNVGGRGGGSMLIVQMTIVENGTSRDLVALVGTDMTVETLQRILQSGLTPPTGAPPASQDMMNSIPKVAIQIKGMMVDQDSKGGEGGDKPTVQVEELTCVVCCEDFTHGEEVRQMPCNRLHCYHESCIMEWLSRHNSCPICRTKLENPQRNGDSNSGDGTSSSGNAESPSASASVSAGEGGSSTSDPSPSDGNGPSTSGQRTGTSEGEQRRDADIDQARAATLRHIVDHIRARALANALGPTQVPPLVPPSRLAPLQPEPMAFRAGSSEESASVPGPWSAFERGIHAFHENMARSASQSEEPSPAERASLVSAARALHSQLQRWQASEVLRSPPSTHTRSSVPRPRSSPPTPVEPRIAPRAGAEEPNPRPPLGRNRQAAPRLPSIGGMLSRSSLPRVGPTPFFLHNHRFANHSQLSSPRGRGVEQTGAAGSGGAPMRGVNSASAIPPQMESRTLDTGSLGAQIPSPEVQGGNAVDARPTESSSPTAAQRGFLNFGPGTDLSHAQRRENGLRDMPEATRTGGETDLGSLSAVPGVETSSNSRSRWSTEGLINQPQQRRPWLSGASATHSITARRRPREQVEISSPELRHARSRRRKSLVNRSEEGTSQSMRLFPRRLQDPSSSSFIGSVAARLRSLGNSSSSGHGDNNAGDSRVARLHHASRSDTQRSSSTANSAVTHGSLGGPSALSGDTRGLFSGVARTEAGPSGNTHRNAGRISSTFRTSGGEPTQARSPKSESEEHKETEGGNVWQRIVNRMRKARRAFSGGSSSTVSSGSAAASSAQAGETGSGGSRAGDAENEDGSMSHGNEIRGSDRH